MEISIERQEKELNTMYKMVGRLLTANGFKNCKSKRASAMLYGFYTAALVLSNLTKTQETWITLMINTGRYEDLIIWPEKETAK